MGGLLLAAALAVPTAHAVTAADDPFAQYKVDESRIQHPDGTTVNLFDFKPYIPHAAYPNTWTSYEAPGIGNFYSSEEGFPHDRDSTAVGASENARKKNDLDAPFWASGLNKDRLLKVTGTTPRALSPSDSQDAANNPGHPAGRGINEWTTNAKPFYGIVNNTLEGGFPVVRGRNGSADQSLDYLFDLNDSEYKEAYSDVKGLLQMDRDGYYYYQSADTDKNGGEDSAGRVGNFASYNKETNSFDLYEAAGVRHHNNGNLDGMFFPFNTADQVFDIQDDKLKMKPREKLNCGVPPINHFFGMSMTTHFVQSEDGLTEAPGTKAKRPVTYEFKGDDDVWVFIDGVLVGDLGGIHDAASLKIDFSTGEVIINEGKSGIGKAEKLYDLYKAAGRADRLQWKETADGNKIYGDDTIHTLRFFYMERAAYASNLQLKFNLSSVPVSELVKTDQYGRSVAGASFDLYATGADYSYDPAKDAPISSGTTDKDGNLALTDASGAPVFFDEWHAAGVDHFVLVESKKPSSAYRSIEPLKLRYVPSTQARAAGFVVSENTFETGAAVNAKVLTRTGALESLKLMNGQSVPLKDDGTGQIEGMMFAVPMKFVGDRSDPDAFRKDENWKGVFGDPVEGWHLSDGTGSLGAVQAALAQYDMARQDAEEEGVEFKKGPYEFAPSNSAVYEVQTPPLPGDIMTYHALLPDDQKDRAEYALGYFWAEPDAFATDKTPEEAAQMVFQLDSSQFKRMFAAHLSIPNIYNRIAVQKVDQDGKPVNGAKFGLFSKNDAEEHKVMRPDGTTDTIYTIKEGATPIWEETTRKLVRNPTKDQPVADGVNLDGAAIFNGTVDKQSGSNIGDDPILEVGKTYFVAETDAPKGYEVNPMAVRFFVSERGVFADAGVQNDGVKVMRDVGMLLATMTQYADNPDINATLHDIVAELQTVPTDPDATTDPDINKIDWTTKGEPLHLAYHDPDALVDYGPSQEEGASPLQVTDTDWSRTKITQCDSDHGTTGTKEDLGDRDLSPHFSGLTIAQIRDRQLNDLQITKVVKGYDGMSSDLHKDREFTYTASFTAPALGDIESLEALPDGWSVKIGDKEIPIKDGQVTFTLKHGQTATVENLPVDVEYVVTESPTEGFEGDVTANGDGVANQKLLTATGSLADADDKDDVMTPVKVGYTNTYKTPDDAVVSTQAGFSKSVVGRDWQKDDEFTFKLTAVDPADAPMPKNATATVKASDAQDGKAFFGFGDIAFKASDLDGQASRVFTYNVCEVLPKDQGGNDLASENGLTFDQHIAELQITLTDTGTGTLVATAALKEGAADGMFTNTYKPADAIAVISARKTLDGRPMLPGEFTFELIDGEHGTGPVLQTATNAAPDESGDATVTFDPISYDAEGTYYYTIAEKAGTAGGVTYDESVKLVVVKVTDNGKGQLIADVTYDGEHNPYRFMNEYKATPATDTLSAKKTVEPVEGTEFTLEADMFEFTLKATAAPDGIEKPADQVKANDAAGDVAFDELSFTAPGTYEFRLTENDLDAVDNPDVAGVSKDSSVYTITYKVVDDGKGALSIEEKTVKVATSEGDSKDVQEIAFKNVYDPGEVTYALTGVKSIETQSGSDRVPLDGEFSFTLTAKDGAPMPEGSADGVKTVSNTGGTFSFGDITFDKPGEYCYAIAEVPGDDATIEYDKAVHDVIVAVADQGGKLGVSVSVVAGDIKFVNSYTPKAMVPVTIQGTKALEGRELKGGEFTFVLMDADGKEIDFATNREDGTFAFDTEFTTDQVGTYTYLVKERDLSAPGITYDRTVYTVTIVVSDSAEHQLIADVTVTAAGEEAEGIAFKNEYKPAPAKLQLSASKVLEGRDMKAGEFSFELREGDHVLQTVKNGEPDKNGVASVLFDELTFDEEGEHEYTVAEVKGDAADMVYDEAVRTVKVTVEDNGEGLLVATADWGDEGASVFKNSYEPDEPEDPEGPDTPDDPDKPGKPGDPGEPGVPGEPGKPGGPGKPAVPGSPALPGTGDQSLVIVLAAAAAGAVAIIAGLIWNRQRDNR